MTLMTKRRSTQDWIGQNRRCLPVEIVALADAYQLYRFLVEATRMVKLRMVHYFARTCRWHGAGLAAAAAYLM